MKRHFALGLVWLVALPAQACTIFVLTDTNRVLFCNNEDYAHPMTRIWFVSAREGRYGCAYIGFDNGLGQGGLNTEGLAYDWVNFGTRKSGSQGPVSQYTKGSLRPATLEIHSSLAWGDASGDWD